MRKNKHITLIVGAGSSVGYIDQLSTAKITEYVKSESFYHDVIRYLKKIYENTNPSLKGSSFGQIKQLLKTLHDIDNNLGGIDFEDIIYLWDKLPHLLVKDMVQSVEIREKLIIKGLSYAQRIKLNTFDDIFLKNFITYFPNIIRALILNYIFKQCDTQTTDEFKKDMQILINTCKNVFDSISIYSLNYDSLIEDSLSGHDFSNGFFDSKFNKRSFYESKYKLAYPHGHIGMFVDNNELKFSSNYEYANNKRLEWIIYNSGINLSDEGELHYNIFMVSGKDKNYIMLNDPFSSYFQNLYVDIMKSDLIIILGYSLRDSHINSCWINMHEINPELTSIIVTNSIFEPAVLHNNPLYKMLAQMHVTFSSSNFEKEYFYEGLCGIKAQKTILFYEKGAQNFMKDSNNIIRVVT